MTTRRRTTESPLQRARSALYLLGESIGWDDMQGESTGVEYVGTGLDAMATALKDLRKLDLGKAPLDEVLAHLGVEDSLVETAAELIELVGKVGYAGGLSEEDVDAAERCREELCDALDNLLTELEEEQADA